MQGFAFLVCPAGADDRALGVGFCGIGMLHNCPGAVGPSHRFPSGHKNQSFHEKIGAFNKGLCYNFFVLNYYSPCWMPVLLLAWATPNFILQFLESWHIIDLSREPEGECRSPDPAKFNI